MEDISCTPNISNSNTPSPENKSILRQLCRLDSHCISRFTAGGPSLHCTIPTESAPSLRFLQGWAAMLPAQLLSVLHRPLCMPSSYPPFSPTRRTGHPHLWWLLQFESRATAFTSWAATPAAQDLRGGSTQRAGRSVLRYAR